MPRSQISFFQIITYKTQTEVIIQYSITISVLFTRIIMITSLSSLFVFVILTTVSLSDSRINVNTPPSLPFSPFPPVNTEIHLPAGYPDALCHEKLRLPSRSAKGKLSSVLRNPVLFGLNLEEAGLAQKVEQMFAEMLKGPGAVRETLRKYLA